MAIDKNALEDVLVEWLSGVTGDVVIIANQGKPRPAGSYSTIQIVSTTPIGTADVELISIPDELVQINYSNLFEILVSLNFFRDNSYLNASKARSSFNLVSVIEDIEAGGLAFISTSDIRDIPNVINKNMEKRSQMDVSFYITDLVTEIIESINKVQVTSGLDGSTVIIP